MSIFASFMALSLLGAGEVPLPLEVFSVTTRNEGAPFVARCVGKSDTELRLEPAAGGEILSVPTGAVTVVKADKEPLRGYLARYGELVRCRWVTLSGRSRPTVGYETTSENGVTGVTVLGAKGDWVGVDQGENGEDAVSWGTALSAAEIEQILGPVPVPAVDEGSVPSGGVEEACAECRGKGELDCPECDTGRIRGPCPRCNGTGKEGCKTCKGGKGVPCTYCKGSGSVRQYRLTGETSFGRCDRCGGRGRLTCPSCNGKGEDACTQCNGSGKTWVTCPKCKGARKIPCRACKRAAAPEAEPGRAAPSEPAIAYARVMTCAAGREAAIVSADLEERASMVAAALAKFKDVVGLYRRYMQSEERPGFRKMLSGTRKTEYDGIQRLYQRGIALQTDLANFAKWTERQRVLLTPEAAAAVSPEIVFSRVRSVREALARNAGKSERLAEGSTGLRSALEREWSAFCARLEREARARAFSDSVAALFEDIPNVKLVRADGEEGVVEVRVAAVRENTTRDALHAVAGRVFPEFSELHTVVAAGKDGIAVSRDEWTARRLEEEEKAQEATASASADNAPAEEKKSSPGKFMLLLCGGAAASFLLLAFVLRGRRNDERYLVE